MNEVFISYSHQDIAFVQRLYDALVEQGFDPWMDSAKLIGSADWWERIRLGIQASASVIFVVTAESLASEVCTMEVHHALKFNKRLIPLVLMKGNQDEAFRQLRIADLPIHILTELEGVTLEEIARKNWRYISQYQWVSFDRGSLVDEHLADLVKALKYDSKYVDQHTAFLNRAINWEDRKRNPGFLLSRLETREMQKWLAESVGKEPPVHESHRLYLTASEKHLARQRIRASLILVSAIAVTLILAILAVFVLRERILNPPPRRLAGNFNVAIAPFLEDTGGTLTQTNDSGKITEIVSRVYANFVNREGLQSLIDYESERIPLVTGTTPDEREASAADIARQVNANVVIYGQINADNELEFHLYVDPLFSGGEELEGETRFGAPIPLRIADLNTPNDQQEVENQILPRNQALAQFLYGLFLTYTYSIDQALEQLKSASEVPQAWDGANSGLEVVYLWMGTAYNLQPYVKRDCIYPADGHGDRPFSLFCARAAYEKALSVNDQFARAYIGLGNVDMNIASPDDFRLAAPFCNGFSQAIDEYNRALALNPGENYAAMTLLEVKTYANIGRANTRALFFRYCPGDWFQPALDAYQKALAAVPVDTTSIVAGWERANILFWIGRTYRGNHNPTDAIDYLNQAIGLIDTEHWPQRWQNLRYESNLEIGNAYQDRTNYGEGDFSQEAIGQYQMIVDAAKDPQRRYDDLRVVSQADYNLGLMIEARDGCAAARPYYEAVLNMDENQVDQEAQVEAGKRCLSSAAS